MQDFNDLLHVGGEGREVLFNALGVADVGEDGFKDRNLTAFRCWNQQAAHCH